MEVQFHALSISRTAGTSASVVPWTMPSASSATFRSTVAELSVPAPTPPVGELETAFEAAERGRWEADWERFVGAMSERRALSAADWRFIWARVASPEPLKFQAAESLARVLSAHAREPLDRFFVGIALWRLGLHPSDAVKVATLEAAADVDVRYAQHLARMMPPASGALAEAIAAVVAMTP